MFPAIYQIHLCEDLCAYRSPWFNDMEIQVDSQGGTLLIGWLQDAPALYGVIDRIRDLGLTLKEVHRVEKEPSQPRS